MARALLPEDLWSLIAARASQLVSRYGVDSRDRLGRWRWVVDQTLGWLHRFRKSRIRHERFCQALLTADAGRDVGNDGLFRVAEVLGQRLVQARLHRFLDLARQ